MSGWNKAYRWLWTVLAAAVAAVSLCLLLREYRRLQALQKDRTAMRGGNREMDGQTRVLIANQEDFRTNSEFVERIARETGRVKTNELVFKMEPSNSNEPSLHEP